MRTGREQERGRTGTSENGRNENGVLAHNLRTGTGRERERGECRERERGERERE